MYYFYFDSGRFWETD